MNWLHWFLLILAAVFFALARMSEQSELTVMRSAGLSLLQLAKTTGSVDQGWVATLNVPV